jgi:hypothetical protein
MLLTVPETCVQCENCGKWLETQYLVSVHRCQKQTAPDSARAANSQSTITSSHDLTDRMSLDRSQTPEQSHGLGTAHAGSSPTSAAHWHEPPVEDPQLEDNTARRSMTESESLERQLQNTIEADQAVHPKCQHYGHCAKAVDVQTGEETSPCIRCRTEFPTPKRLQESDYSNVQGEPSKTPVEQVSEQLFPDYDELYD